MQTFDKDGSGFEGGNGTVQTLSNFLAISIEPQLVVDLEMEMEMEMETVKLEMTKTKQGNAVDMGS